MQQYCCTSLYSTEKGSGLDPPQPPGMEPPIHSLGLVAPWLVRAVNGRYANTARDEAAQHIKLGDFAAG